MRIAGLQHAGTPGDVDANLAVLDDAAGRAVAEGCRLLITSEMFLTGYAIGPRVQEFARQPWRNGSPRSLPGTGWRSPSGCRCPRRRG